MKETRRRLTKEWMREQGKWLPELEALVKTISTKFEQAFERALFLICLLCEGGG